MDYVKFFGSRCRPQHGPMSDTIPFARAMARSFKEVEIYNTRIRKMHESCHPPLSPEGAAFGSPAAARRGVRVSVWLAGPGRNGKGSPLTQYGCWSS